MTSATEVEVSNDDDEWNEDGHEDDTDIVSSCHDCERYDRGKM
jgi:hypothetical protein